MISVQLVLGLLAGLGLGYVLARRGRSLKSAWLLTFDGSGWLAEPATVLKSGNIRVGSVEHSIGLCRRVVSSASVQFFVLAAEPVPLADHRMLEQSRRAILTGALFRTGGDIMQLLQIGAVVAVIASSIYVYSSVASLHSAVARQQVVLEAVQKWTESPLEVKK